MKVDKPSKLRWGSDAFDMTGSAAARNVRLSHRKSEQIREWERYGLCSRCGSQDLRSVRDRGFVPTGLAEARRLSDDITPNANPLESVMPESRAERPEWNIGDRVVIRQLGFRGKTGAVLKRGILGGYSIKLDDGSIVRAVDGAKMERLNP
ncbi:MAG TPA: hypothetical protein VGP02_14870 [Mycobacteriales bacterium]|nr:hypothetical protein [Mycobacteriales bacterium]